MSGEVFRQVLRLETHQFRDDGCVADVVPLPSGIQVCSLVVATPIIRNSQFKNGQIELVGNKPTGGLDEFCGVRLSSQYLSNKPLLSAKKLLATFSSKQQTTQLISCPYANGKHILSSNQAGGTRDANSKMQRPARL